MKKILTLRWAAIIGLLHASLYPFACADSATSHEGLREHQNESVTLPNKSLGYISPSADVLNVTVLNTRHFIGKGKIKHESAEDLFNAKTLLYPKRLFEFAAKYYEENDDAQAAVLLRKLANVLPEQSVLRLPAHKFRVGDALGNRVIFYGGKNERANAPGHKHIDLMTHDIGMPLVKIMTYFNEAQGGSLADILYEGDGGMSHAGGLYAGWSEGEPVSVRSEWPPDYGTLDDDNYDYNAHILAIDYQAGTKSVIPDKVLADYHHNFALWDVFTGLMIPFSLKSQFKEYRDYSYNPLELTDTASMEELAKVTASLDGSKVRFTSYCSEGQWNIANLAVNILIQKGRFPKFDQLITEFQRAPDYQQIPSDQHYKYPEIGWEWLSEKGLISDKMYKNLIQTNRRAVYLNWIDESVVPWTAYQPLLREDGLIADPMTLGTLVQMILRTYYPRDKIAKGLVKELVKAYQSGGNEIRQVIQLLIGDDPASTSGGEKLYGMMIRLVSMELAYALQQEEVKETLFGKLGYEYIISADDKQKVDTLYNRYIESLMNPELSQRNDFDKKLQELDNELKTMSVRMKIYGPEDRTKRNSVADAHFFMWAAPQSWVFWAKYSSLLHSPSVRYVTTAMHYVTDRKSRPPKEKDSPVIH